MKFILFIHIRMNKIINRTYIQHSTSMYTCNVMCLEFVCLLLIVYYNVKALKILKYFESSRTKKIVQINECLTTHSKALVSCMMRAYIIVIFNLNSTLIWAADIYDTYNSIIHDSKRHFVLLLSRRLFFFLLQRN